MDVTYVEISIAIFNVLVTGIITAMWLDIKNAKESQKQRCKNFEEIYLDKKTHELICRAHGLELGNRIDLLEQRQNDRFSALMAEIQDLKKKIDEMIRNGNL